MSKSNTLPAAAEFKPLATIEGQPGIGDVMVGDDLRLYRQTNGLLELIVECEPREKTKAQIYYKGLKLDDYPSMGELAHLYDTFLSKYKREVMFVVGKYYDREGFFYMVPEQVGTSGSIEWDDKKGMSWFAKRARFLGTVHIHPGTGTAPSTTDVDGWKKKICSGIHVIFGRDENFSMSASVAGVAINVATGDVKGIERTKVNLFQSLNRKMKRLLKTPKPVIRTKWKGYTGTFKYRDYLQRLRPGTRKGMIDVDKYLEDMFKEDDDLLGNWGEDVFGDSNSDKDSIIGALLDAGAVSLQVRHKNDKRAVLRVRVVMFGGHAWMMTQDQYDAYLDSAMVRGAALLAPIGKALMFPVHSI